MKKYCLAIALVALLALVGCAEHEHSWDGGVVTNAATCTEKGEMTYTCLVCEATRTEEIDPLGHKLDAGTVSEPATCTKEGTKTFKCERCDYVVTEPIPMVDHTPGEDFKCSGCGQYFYPSLEEFNSKVTLENSKGVVVTVKLGDETFGNIAYSEHKTGYTGKGLWIGRAYDEAEALNKYGATPAKIGEYTYVFKGGTITSTATGYASIDGLNGTSVYMFVPGNADVVFDGVTFDGVFSFDVQMYTSPWSYLNSITFKNCTFKGILVGTAPAYNVTFDGCVFNDYTNTVDANNSNPIWWRSGNGSWSGSGSHQAVSMKSFIFTNNKVYGSRPVKIERVGNRKTGSEVDYEPVVKVIDNYFDISYPNKADDPSKEKHMAFNIGQSYDTNEAKNVVTYASPFTLYDDGNEISSGTKSLYTAATKEIVSNLYFESKGTKILDRNGNPKEITAHVWKSATETFVMKSIN